MAIADLIAEFITNAIDDSAEGFAEMQRGSLAERFSCAPSQINYVISTRFSPERGYLVTSRRGGGGYIRIARVRQSPRELLMHMVNAVGDRLDASTARAFVMNLYDAQLADRDTARLLSAAVSDNALRPLDSAERDVLRASIFKQLLVTLGSE